MAKLPQPIHQTVAAIYAAWEEAADGGLRGHLGASEIGDDCMRRLWYSFRWAELPRWDGRMLRLFDTGKREEPRIEADLMRIGCDVTTVDGNGRQWTVSECGGHFGGSLDGAVLGLPEAPKTWHVLEIKTANEKSWKALARSGVKESQYRHWAQMQVYMHLTGMKRAAYISVNKNSDEIYLERIEHDKEAAVALIERANRVINSPEPPPRISEDAEWWQCKSCRFAGICHGTDVPLVNCRTCAHSTPISDGNSAPWTCAIRRTEWKEYGTEKRHLGLYHGERWIKWLKQDEKREHDQAISVEEQRAGCVDHRYIPTLLEKFADQVDVAGTNVEYQNRLTGTLFSNGELSSAEIRALNDKAMLGQERVDPVLKRLRNEFGGTYAG